MNIHLSYLLCGLLLLLSCNNEELIQEYEKDVPIRFRSLCVEISTKSINNSSILKDSQISLFSIQHLPNNSVSSWIPNLFNNTKGISDLNGDILYDNTYFFPTGNELDFFAIHPFISSATTGFDYDDTQYTTVTLNANATDQYDLMYASLLNQSKKSPLLIFEFYHY